MATQIFVNLPVRDLDKSVQFFTKLGFKFNAQFGEAVAGQGCGEVAKSHEGHASDDQD